ncbi:MAG: amidase [Cardiobacteriaceae bacterium]|nr:amidase [Cardiobacteriaceae bacterium]
MNPPISPLRAQLAVGRSAHDVTRHCLDAIARYNPALNAVVTFNPDALQDAARANALADTARGLLHGLPITVKDCFATAGLRTTSGHPPLADYVPQEDAELVARLRAQGAVLIGKTNLPPLAGDIQCANPVFGRTHNPFDPALTSGGSSGGSAVAVAAGFSVLDLGSDLGGSIRIPAAFCGVAGMKITEGRWPLAGHIPPLPDRMRSVWHMLSPGLLARHVDDLRLGFAALDDKPLALPALPRSLRIAWCDDFSGIPLCRRTHAGLQQAVARLQAQGHQLVRDRPVDFDFREVWNTYGEILGVEIGLGLPRPQRWMLRAGRCFLPEKAHLTRAFVRGLRMSMDDYHQAFNVRLRLIAALESFLDGYDTWLCPVCPLTAFPHAPYRLRLPSLTIDDTPWPYLDAGMALTVPFSLTGSPVISLPAGLQDGLPVGLQLIGKRHQDERLLAVAGVVEKAGNGFYKAPLIKDFQ